MFSEKHSFMTSVSYLLTKDTVTTNEQDHEIYGHKKAGVVDATIGINAIVHDFVPILTG